MMRNNKIIIVVLFLSLIVLACNKYKKAIEFDIPYSADFTITTGGMTLNAPIDFTTPDINTDISSRLGEHKTDIQFIDEIKYTEFKIMVKAPVGQNLDFLKSIDLYISASGVNEKLVASKNPVPLGDSTIVMELPDVNIKNYITKEKFKIRALIVPDATLSQTVTLTMAQNVHVKAKQFFK